MAKKTEKTIVGFYEYKKPVGPGYRFTTYDGHISRPCEEPFDERLQSRA